MYKFFDRDYYLNDGFFAITGEHYKELIRVCFQHSAYFSVEVFQKTELFQHLEPWCITGSVPCNIHSGLNSTTQYYQAVPETYTLLIQYTSNFFEKRLLPSEVSFENITFFRNDFTVFFEEISHEGECTLYSRENEDVSSVVCFDHWLPCNEDHIPVIPAKQCSLPPLNNYAFEKDPFFQLLMAIYDEPKKYLKRKTIDQLEAFINRLRLDNMLHFTDSKKTIHIPIWYTFFEIYIWKECDALTTTSLVSVLTKNGYSGEQAFERYYEFLLRFSCM